MNMGRYGWALGLAVAATLLAGPVAAEPTYAERLGWPEGTRVVIFHADDLGMHLDENRGTIEAIENGVVNSASTMMPCPWVPHWAAYLKDNPGFDNGLHLTLTSEWTHYKWGPVAGAARVPGLVDAHGYFYPGVRDVIEHASPDEVEIEIRAQVDKAGRMGLPVTHLDSHMGTLQSYRPFFERYVKVCIETGLPIQAVGGHGTQARQMWPEAVDVIEPFVDEIWEGGLPLLDDIDMRSYNTADPAEKKAILIDGLRNMKPGITEIIVHCALPSPVIEKVLNNPQVRYVDTQVMTDPEIAQLIQDEGIVLTTWRELKERRDRVGAAGE